MYKRSRVPIRAELIFLFFILLAVPQRCFARSCDPRISCVIALVSLYINLVPVWLICRPYSYRRFSLLTRRCKTSCFKKSAQNLFSHIHVSCVFFFFRHFHISHNAPYLPPKILHNLCFSLQPSQEIYAKFGGANKAHYRKCGSGIPYLLD